MMLAVGFSYMAFVTLRYAPSIPTFTPDNSVQCNSGMLPFSESKESMPREPLGQCYFLDSSDSRKPF